MTLDWTLLAALGFVLTHVLLGTPPLRTLMRRALGEQTFVAVFSLIAATSLSTVAVSLYFAPEATINPWHQYDPRLRMLAGAIAIAGMTLALAGLPAYPKSPMAILKTTVPAPQGIGKITRHSFFVGFAIFCAAHSLLLAHRGLAIMMLCLGALAAGGALFQDRKLILRHGEAYRAYMATTSIVPFLALLRGRARLDADDHIIRHFARAIVVTALMLALHPLWRIGNGATFPLALAAGGFYLSWRRWRAARLTRAKSRQDSHQSNGAEA